MWEFDSLVVKTEKWSCKVQSKRNENELKTELEKVMD